MKHLKKHPNSFSLFFGHWGLALSGPRGYSKSKKTRKMKTRNFYHFYHFYHHHHHPTFFLTVRAMIKLHSSSSSSSSSSMLFLHKRPSYRYPALIQRKKKGVGKTITQTKARELEGSTYDEQKRKRLNHMPWLYDIEKHKTFAKQWQKEWQQKLMELETIEFIGEDTFIADVNMNVFAERGRAIIFNNHCRIAANVYLHGPIEVGENVSINQHCHMEGPIRIGADTRIGPSTSIFAFNHNFDDSETPIRLQKVKKEGVRIGENVWIGANVSIVDGVTIGAHSVVGIASVVTKNIPDNEVWAGNPCKKIGERKRQEK